MPELLPPRDMRPAHSSRLKWMHPLSFLLCVLFASAAAHLGAEESDPPLEFERDVAPILIRKCLRCHNEGHARGEFSLATAEDLVAAGYVTAGDPDASYLLELIAPDGNERPAMPKEGKPLLRAEIQVILRWIAEGALWPEHVVLEETSRADSSWWSLQPLAEVTPPSPDGMPARWSRNAIDRFIYADLVRRGLTPSERADRRTLIRRAAYDLTGLPPTPGEIDAFLADDSPAAYERLIDRLLATPHYGEHWGRHWLDVIRFGESTGFERNVIIDNAWPFRDYVIDSLNRDKPFDQFLREHLAGDVVGPGQPDVEVGTTFLVCGPYDNVGNQDEVQAAQIRANTIDEMIRATAEAFLGMTVGCARCHNHKFDPITQRDYYGWYATFAGVQHGARVVASPEDEAARTAAVAPLNEALKILQTERGTFEEAIQVRAEAGAAAAERTWARPPVDRTGTEERFPPVSARYVRLVAEGRDTNPEARTGFRIDEFEAWTAGTEPRNVAASVAGGKASGSSRVAQDFGDAYSPALAIDGRFGASWIAAAPELVIQFARPETIQRVLFSSDRPAAAGGHEVATFLSEYRLEVSLDGQNWTEVANSHDRRPVNSAHRGKRLFERAITPDERARLEEYDRQIEKVRAKLQAIPELPRWWIGTFQTAPGPFHVFLGGDPQRPGDPVFPNGLSVLAEQTGGLALSEAAPESERRMALANWITSAANPLAARVLANRLWHYHFGTGIVDTPSDFGAMGGPPSHPMLLDWLAAKVVADGWRLKPLHRQIMLSETYRQAGTWRAEAASADADSRWLWRFPPRRLSAEEIRDTLLAISGALDRRQGGPGFRLYKYLEDNVATYVPLDEHGPQTWRRSVYHQNARAARVDLMTDFDSPDCAFAEPRRMATTTPLQALTMLNHQFTLQMASMFAERLAREAVDEREARLKLAYRLAYGREPTVQEQQAGLSFVAKHGWPAYCRVLLNTNELIYID